MNVIGVNKYNPASGGDFSKLDVKSANSMSVSSESQPSKALSSNADGEKVQISKAGRDALASDNGSRLHAQSSQVNAQADAAAAEESGSPKKKIDELIEALKERVEELKAELKSLESDKTEAGEKKRKDLQSQIAVLSAQISDLINQKLEQEKKEQLMNA